MIEVSIPLRVDGMTAEPERIADRSGPPSIAPSEPVREDQVPTDLAQAIRGFHLRAARALLDWPMPVLAEASDLSLSTVKRLEETLDQPLSRSRLKAILALHRAGIRFFLLDDGSVAVAKPKSRIIPDMFEAASVSAR